jgi:L-ascorbate metabolism protein UlaG (beta-lactamase superfamily)
MRLKLGRPDLAIYADHFDVPAADPDDLSVTFLGVATLHVDDGTSAVMTDGFFTRPSLPRVAFGKIAPDPARIDDCLSRAGITRLEAVVPVHGHYDHALDSAVVAERTGALVVGGETTANIARGHGLAESQIRIVSPTVPCRLGSYDVTMFESRHCPPDRYPGAIMTPVVPPARVTAFRCGEAWSIHLMHRPSGKTLLIIGSAGWTPGALRGVRADVAYLGIGQLGLQSEEYLTTYWEETVRTVGARRVVLIHWDDFFHPLTEPLRANPYAGDDVDVSWRVLSSLADEYGVAIHFPTVWERQDPWASLG